MKTSYKICFPIERVTERLHGGKLTTIINFSTGIDFIYWHYAKSLTLLIRFLGFGIAIWRAKELVF